MAKESLWQIADKHRKAGRPVIFKTPEDVWKAALAYFEWADNNPLWETKPFAFQGSITDAPIAKMRAFTLNGFCLHAGICEETWRNYKGKDGFLGVCTQIEQAIREQKFTGAAADLLNPAIIARDLGLADKTDNTVVVKSSTLDAESLSTETLTELLAARERTVNTN